MGEILTMNLLQATEVCLWEAAKSSRALATTSHVSKIREIELKIFDFSVLFREDDWNVLSRK